MEQRPLETSLLATGPERQAAKATQPASAPSLPPPPSRRNRATEWEAGLYAAEALRLGPRTVRLTWTAWRALRGHAPGVVA